MPPHRRTPDAPTGPPSDPRTDQRLTALEEKACFADDLLDHLNTLVARQQQQIDRLLREVARLNDQLAQGPDQPFRSLRDEIPPHY